MKKQVLIFLMILSVALVSASPSLNIPKKEYQPGETLIGSITGEFARSVSVQDIKFYEGRRQVFFDYDLIAYNNTYYFYTYLTHEGNFTLSVENVLYKDSGLLQSITLNKEIEVRTKKIIHQQEINNSGNITYINITNTQILGIQPGFVISTEPKITLINKGDSDLNISVDKNITLIAAGQSVTIAILTNRSFSFFNVSSYERFSVPVFLINLKSNDSHELPYEHTDIRVSNQSLQLKMIASEHLNETLNIINIGDENFSNIVLQSNSSLISHISSLNLSARGIYPLPLSFYSEATGFFSDDFYVKFSQNNKTYQIRVPIEMYVFPKINNSNYSENFSFDTQDSCTELNGELCVSGQSCNGTLTYASGPCCTADDKGEGNCYFLEDDTSGATSYTWLWIIIIFGLLGVGGYFLYKKIKATAPKKPEDKLDQVSKLYQQKISGGLSRV